MAVLVGIVLLIAGFFASGDARAGLITAGILTASFAGLELSVREHFAGYRSHSSLLAGVVAFLVGLPLWLVLGARYIALACALVAAAAAFWALRAAFARRAGGLTFRA